MKTINKQITTKVFVCSVCNTQYESIEEAQECEKRHLQISCKHKNLEFHYEFGAWVSTGTKWSGDVIEVSCKDCNAYFGRKNLLRSQTKEIDKFFKKLFLDSPSDLNTPTYWKFVTKPKNLK